MTQSNPINSQMPPAMVSIKIKDERSGKSVELHGVLKHENQKTTCEIDLNEFKILDSGKPRQEEDECLLTSWRWIDRKAVVSNIYGNMRDDTLRISVAFDFIELETEEEPLKKGDDLFIAKPKYFFDQIHARVVKSDRQSVFVTFQHGYVRSSAEVAIIMPGNQERKGHIVKALIVARPDNPVPKMIVTLELEGSTAQPFVQTPSMLIQLNAMKRKTLPEISPAPESPPAGGVPALAGNTEAYSVKALATSAELTEPPAEKSRNSEIETAREPTVMKSDAGQAQAEELSLCVGGSLPQVAFEASADANSPTERQNAPVVDVLDDKFFQDETATQQTSHSESPVRVRSKRERILAIVFGFLGVIFLSLLIVVVHDLLKQMQKNQPAQTNVPAEILLPMTADNLKKFFYQNDPSCMIGKVSGKTDANHLGIRCAVTPTYDAKRRCSNVMACNIVLPAGQAAAPGAHPLTADLAAQYFYEHDISCFKEASYPYEINPQYLKDGLRIQGCKEFNFDPVRTCFDYSPQFECTLVVPDYTK